MKLTNLEYVQNILSALNSDEVNSVSDTTESLQVLEILRTSYFNIIARAELPEQKKPYQLDPSLSVLEPTLMYLPDTVKSMEWLKYFDTTDAMYKYVTILPLQQFSDYVNGFDSTAAEVDALTLSIGAENFTFYYKDNTQPLYCTVVKDYYVIFDSYDNTLDSTLQSSKTMAFGLTTPTFLMTDTFVPDLDESQVPLLLNEAKSLAFFELKQTLHSKAEQEAKRQWNTLQKNKSIDNKPSYFDQLPNFARNTRINRGPYIRW